MRLMAVDGPGYCRDGAARPRRGANRWTLDALSPCLGKSVQWGATHPRCSGPTEDSPAMTAIPSMMCVGGSRR
jgi:hypothetical protein